MQVKLYAGHLILKKKLQSFFHYLKSGVQTFGPLDENLNLKIVLEPYIIRYLPTRLLQHADEQQCNKTKLNILCKKTLFCQPDIRYTVCIPETFQIRIKKKFSLKKNIMSHCLGFGRFVYDCSVLYVQLIVFVQFVYEQF